VADQLFPQPDHVAAFLITPAGLPLTRLPVYAEVTGTSTAPLPQPPADRRLDDLIQQALRADAAENLGEPEPRRRLTSAMELALARSFGAAASDVIGDGDPHRLIPEVIAAARSAQGGTALRNIAAATLDNALDGAIAATAARLGIPLAPAPTPSTTRWSCPLGVLATDHVGYLSFDLTRLPAYARSTVAAALQARRQDPAAVLDTTITLHPASHSGPSFELIGQNRLTANAIVGRVELAQPDLPDQVANLGLPAMQNPSLADWQLSPGSFATSPGALVGADGCETLLPANLALQEFHFYQAVRLTDVAAPATNPAGQVQLGIVNDYRIAWYPLGHSLGQIQYSLPLAPGESVNLAVIDWTRRDSAQRKEVTSLDEQLVHDEHRDRGISETVASAVQEYQHGSSFMGGIAGAGGGSYMGLSAGIAGSLGGSTASSSGNRNVTGSTLQTIADNISQVSTAQRELQSTVVVQSVQAEKEAIETRTVVNYNHSHALTVLYYEVLRHFRVVTGLVGQRPAVLVRLRQDWFAEPSALTNILAQRRSLSAALLEPSLADGFDALARTVSVGGAMAALDTPLPGPPAPPTPDPSPPPPPPYLRYFTFEMTTGSFVRPTDDHDKHMDVLATLLLEDGSAIDLANIDGGGVLNNFGAFSQPNSIIVFSAVAKGQVTVSWPRIVGVAMAVVVWPLGFDTAKVSFSHIKISGIDPAGPPGLVLVDQPYEGGHLIITNGNDERNRRLTFPVHRPPPAPPPPPFYPDAQLADRGRAIALLAHLRAHVRFYSRAIALGMDPFERADALDAINIISGGTVLGLLENRPLEVVGDYLAYPCIDANRGARITAALAEGEDRMTAAATQDERLVTLPTRGVFAEARLGHCNASELIDNTRFWDWQQSPIPHLAPEIAPTTPVTPQPVQQNLSPTAFPSPIVNIVNPPAAPDPTGLADAMKVLATPNLFRDMSGQTQVAGLLQNLADNAVKIATGKSTGGGGTGGGLGGSLGTGGAAGAIGGPRATATQPSAANRDLHDLQPILGQAQTKGLITPEAAQAAYTQAVQGAVGSPMLAFQLDDPDVGGTVGDLQSPDPVHADEADQVLLTYSFDKFAIFVPQAVLFASRDEMTDVKVHLFFTAGAPAMHDLLVHGVRGASNQSDWVTITIPGQLNSSVMISDDEIIRCLRTADVKGSPTALRLTGHSRGCDSLMATLSAKKIKNLELIDRVTFLDEAVEHAADGSVRLNRIANLQALGVSASKAVAYEVGNRSVNTATGVSAHISQAMYVDLTPNCMGAVGLVRLIQDQAELKAAVASALEALPSLKALTDGLGLPPRGSFSTKGAAGKTSFTDFCQTHTTQVQAIVAGLSATSTSVLAFAVRHNLSGYGSNFPWGTACHHFFVAEIAHELVD
jgi:hypothetical protein